MHVFSLERLSDAAGQHGHLFWSKQLIFGGVVYNFSRVCESVYLSVCVYVCQTTTLTKALT